VAKARRTNAIRFSDIKTFRFDGSIYNFTMKCTWIIEGGKVCGKETGKDCPPEWIKHQQFSALVLKIFFMGTKYDSSLDSLESFCCKEHRAEYLHNLSRSRIMSKSKQKYIEDYSI